MRLTCITIGLGKVFFFFAYYIRRAAYRIGYPCLHESCEAKLPSETALEQHYLAHHSVSGTGNLHYFTSDESSYHYLPKKSTDLDFDLTQDHLQPSLLHNADPGPSIVSGHSANSYNNGLNSNFNPNFDLTAVGDNANAMMTSSSTHAAQGAIASTSLNPRATVNGNQAFHCPFPGCSTATTRLADLERHYKKHLPGPKEFGCPNHGCSRKGNKGFERKDKLVAHVKTCRWGPRV